MPEITFVVYCGICGNGCCDHTDVDLNDKRYKRPGITVTCVKCKAKLVALELKVKEQAAQIEKMKKRRGLNCANQKENSGHQTQDINANTQTGDGIQAQGGSLHDVPAIQRTRQQGPRADSHW